MDQEILQKFDETLDALEASAQELHDTLVAHCTKCGDEIQGDEDSLCGNCA